jgi:hypothetical protein
MHLDAILSLVASKSTTVIHWQRKIRFNQVVIKQKSETFYFYDKLINELFHESTEKYEKRQHDFEMEKWRER